MRPLKFKPVNIGTIWGSEDWILSAMEGRQTVCISEGPDSGKTLSELIDTYKEELVGGKGWKAFGTRFPLLVKYINSNQQLSVQVHPDDAMAKKRNLPNGKSEMWYVLEAKEDSELLIGFSKRFSPEEFEAIVRNSIQEKDVLKGEKTLEDVLNRFRPARGDWYFIPAGTVHSIGAGTRILEIQQPSDTTYRLYDFNRVDIEGKKRHLDIEDAIQAIDFTETQEKTVEQQRNVSDYIAAQGGKDTAKSSLMTIPLVSCKHFSVSVMDFSDTERDGGFPFIYNHDYSATGSFSILVCTAGAGKLFYSAIGSCIKESLPIENGDLFLLPAELGAVQIQSTKALQLVEAHI